MANLYICMLTMFLVLCQILHINIMCSLLSTLWCVSFIWYRVAVCFCWFLTLFPRNTWKKFQILFRICHFLNTKTNREKSGEFQTLRIRCACEFAVFGFDGDYCSTFCLLIVLKIYINRPCNNSRHVSIILNVLS